ncbi:hypothetical protein RND81_02G174200 [Saponaria officinalis]|uniref:Uncharacterized protein n=1 Tax=Saponaria officinalis TaxID=3572 RepID=A0AAW1MYP9_SAPOF
MTSFHFPQFELEPFFRYFDRLVEFTAQYDHYFETWELCHIVYSGINNETWAIFNSLNGENFDYLRYDDNWEVFRHIAYETCQSDLNTPPLQSNVESNLENLMTQFINSQNQKSDELTNVMTQLRLSCESIQETVTTRLENPVHISKEMDNLEHHMGHILIENDDCADSYVVTDNSQIDPEVANVDEFCTINDFNDDLTFEEFNRKIVFNDDHLVDNSEDVLNVDKYLPDDMSAPNDTVSNIFIPTREGDAFFDDDDDCFESFEFIDHSPPIVEVTPIIIEDELKTNDEIVDSCSRDTILDYMGVSVIFEDNDNGVYDTKLNDYCPSKECFIAPLTLNTSCLVYPPLFDQYLPHLNDEPKRDLELISDYRDPRKFLICRYVPILYVLNHIINHFYCHFAEFCARLFDRLLRALSCSAFSLLNWFLS